MAFTLLFEWFRNTFVCIKSFKVNNLLIQIDDSHFFQTGWNWNCFSGRKGKVWGDKGETICPFRKPDKPLQVYIVFDPSICFSNRALSCIPAPVYFFVVIVVKSPCHHSRIANRSQLFSMYDPGFVLRSVSQMVVCFHCFYTWALPAVMSVCSSCTSPLHFRLHVCFFVHPALVVFFIFYYQARRFSPPWWRHSQFLYQRIVSSLVTIFVLITCPCITWSINSLLKPLIIFVFTT